MVLEGLKDLQQPLLFKKFLIRAVEELGRELEYAELDEGDIYFKIKLAFDNLALHVRGCHMMLSDIIWGMEFYEPLDKIYEEAIALFENLVESHPSNFNKICLREAKDSKRKLPESPPLENSR